MDLLSPGGVTLYLGVWQPVLVVDEQGMKRHVVCKKCIMPYAADRVSKCFGGTRELLCLQLYHNTL